MSTTTGVVDWLYEDESCERSFKLRVEYRVTPAECVWRQICVPAECEIIMVECTEVSCWYGQEEITREPMEGEAAMISRWLDSMLQCDDSVREQVEQKCFKNAGITV